MAKARRRRAPRLSPAERRAALVAVAARVMLRRGYAATQVSHVVREAGVSRGTFYRHFESKRQLLAALARDLLDRILPGFDRPPDVGSREALTSALESIARRAFETVARDRPVARLVLVGGAASEPAAIRLLAAHDASWRTLVERLLSRARAARVLDDGVDIGLAADLIVGATQRVLRSSVLRITVLGKSGSSAASRTGPTDVAALAAALARLQVAAVARR